MKMALPLHVPRFVNILNVGGKLKGQGLSGEFARTVLQIRVGG